MLREDLFVRYGGGMNAQKQGARLDGLYPIGERGDNGRDGSAHASRVAAESHGARSPSQAS